MMARRGSRPRFATFAAVLGLTVGVAACGAATKAPLSTAASTTSTAASPASGSTEQFPARLLDVGALGEGWQLGSEMTPEDLASVVSLGQCQQATIDPTVAKRLTASTGIQFEPTDHSYKHIIELVISGDPGNTAIRPPDSVAHGRILLDRLVTERGDGATPADPAAG